jgi:predicted dithiol-disulfide oxidoreductase (DUF899 family)
MMLVSTYRTPLEDKMQHHPVVSREEWLAARKALLLKEKEFTHRNEKTTMDFVRRPQ